MKDPVLKVLLLEDEPAHAEAVQRAFRSAGLQAEIRVVGTLREYREAASDRPPDIVLMDLVLPDGRALEALASQPGAGRFPVLIMTSHGDEQAAVDAMKAGALDYVVKSPEAIAAIPRTVQRALREWSVTLAYERAEAALRESEKRFRTLYENSTLGLYRTTPAGRILLANPALIKMLGYSSFEELAARDLRKDGFEPSYPRDEFMRLIEKEGEIRGLESAWKRRDGTVLHVRESARAIRDAEGRIVHFDGTVEDITSRKLAEQNLALEQSLLRALLENATDQVYFKDVDSRFLRISRAQASRFGLSDPALAVGKSDFDFFAAEHARQALRDEQEIVRFGRPLVDQEEMETWPDGRMAWVSSTKVPLRDQQGRIFGTFGISRDITERKLAEERLNETLRRLRQAINSTVQVLGMTVDARDPYTSGHQLRTTLLAEAIARELGWPPDRIEGLRMAGQVHDIGKISVPSEILSKPTALTATEYKLIKTHAKKGYEILKNVEFPWPLAEIVHQHHERMDGSGYPRGLKGEDILMEARILAVADTVEAMVSDRPYRPAPGIAVALAEIDGQKGRIYDASAAGSCLRLFRDKGFRFPT